MKDYQEKGIYVRIDEPKTWDDVPGARFVHYEPAELSDLKAALAGHGYIAVHGNDDAMKIAIETLKQKGMVAIKEEEYELLTNILQGVSQVMVDNSDLVDKLCEDKPKP